MKAFETIELAQELAELRALAAAQLKPVTALAQVRSLARAETARAGRLQCPRSGEIEPLGPVGTVRGLEPPCPCSVVTDKIACRLGQQGSATISFWAVGLGCQLGRQRQIGILEPVATPWSWLLLEALHSLAFRRPASWLSAGG